MKINSLLQAIVSTLALSAVVSAIGPIGYEAGLIKDHYVSIIMLCVKILGIIFPQ